MSKFDIRLEKNGEELKVTVTGVIDEDADFSPHNLSSVQKINMHLGAVKSINSCGIREWIKWIATAQGTPINYFECPKIIVDQINMVQGFLPANAKVQSFYVPYYCDDAGSEKTILFTYGKEFTDTEVKPPTEVKDEDGNVMEMDVVEAKYFKFIKK